MALRLAYVVAVTRSINLHVFQTSSPVVSFENVYVCSQEVANALYQGTLS
jgi:hypothetical protein